MSENGRMRLRSSVPQEEREAEKLKKQKEEEEFRNRPPIQFKGKKIYIRDFIECALACDNLIKLADEAADVLVLGFDVEWPFSFQTGPGKAALIQISPDLDTCYLIQISDLKKLPKGLSVLLAHPKVRITGVNIKNDIRKLSRDFAGFDVEKNIENCIDSGVLANQILPFQQRWSMERLVTFLLKMTISKDNKVRMSKWHVSPLSKEQLDYAATDAYASLVLYNELKKREAQEENDSV
ncbi:3'-5' exonuclease [Tribolium castaneum]|uniref:3'-5' exonuclease n=1 Tax=Tribolium castaneum TaxID=7070 RepID=D6W7R8_TRICA|nr:PREDICTED: Werner Syndrome-like exonuclease [Tribolium castaneum]EFA11337.1 Werner Syndrome-like exonuclease [Tribolium castaneum]|eukprot:XP_973448.1 PREDICTED: Werner Syndrome-like exonuclease [Tribolium castaneum]